MKPSLLLFPLLASCAAPFAAAPAPPIGSAMGKVTVLYGERELDDDLYGPLDEQDMLGATVSWGARHGLGWEIGLLGADSSETVNVLDVVDDVDVDTLEAFGGVRWTFGGFALLPFVSGGLSWIQTEVDGTLDSFDDHEEDDSFGVYLQAGLDAWITDFVSVGIEYRVLIGTELDLFDEDSDGDYGQLAVTLGVAF